MSNLSGFFKKGFALLLSFISLLALSGPATFSPLDAENIKLNFNILADTHIDEIWNGGRTPLLIKGLTDMSKAETQSDALVIAGDMTERGSLNEYFKLAFALNVFCDTDNLLLQMGNHDIRGIKDTQGNSLIPYEYSTKKFFNLMEKTTGSAPEAVYYYKIIKGCYFIVLNPEWMEGMFSCLSETQLEWLDSVLAEASDDGNPVFIVNHQPLSAVGDESGELAGIMQKYDGVLDVFFITGHYHDGFGPNSIMNDGTVYFVDTPCYGKSNSGDYSKTGTGFHVELYEDEIIFRARDFTEGKWVAEYDRTIELIDG